MQKLKLLFTLFILSLCPSYRLGDRFEQRQFIIWNVGQGQWTSLVTTTECLHFDVGGEFDLSKKVIRLCREKLNKVYLSHWDWDHVGLVAKFRSKASRICLAARPLGPASIHKEQLLDGIEKCPNADEQVTGLFKQPLSDFKFLKKSKKSANHLSSVFWLKFAKILIPGDSTTDEEKVWSHEIPTGTRGLILGHHGSQSSTSKELLRQLPELAWAVSSARFSRYGHPHKKVVMLLAQKKIPLLRTEDWGTLHFYQR